MTKIARLFSLLVILFFSSTFAISDNFIPNKIDLEKYRLYVTKVDPEFHCISLSNNLVLNIIQKSDELPDIGAEVFINSNMRYPDTQFKEVGELHVFYNKGFRLVCLSAWIAHESELNLLTCAYGESVCKNSGIIFGCWENRHILKLSDGSIWIISDESENFQEKQSFFKPGDRLIISILNLDTNIFRLVNIDKPLLVSNQILGTCSQSYYSEIAQLLRFDIPDKK
jgi:hypothetical protein